MVGLSVTTSFKGFKLLKAVKDSFPKDLKKAAYWVWKDMRAGLSVDGNGKPSQPGTPPHKQRGRLMQSVLYGADGDMEMVIGSLPRKGRGYGKIHEHGATLKTKSPILKRFSAGYEGWAEFSINPRRIMLLSQAQADRATKINRWLAKKAAQARYQAKRIGAQDKDKKLELVAGYEPEYAGEDERFVTFPARPFAQPALENNLSRLPWAFKDSLNGG